MNNRHALRDRCTLKALDDPISLTEGAIKIPSSEIIVSLARSSGPGGQHVNKTETKVTLRFSVRESPSLPPWARARLLEKLAPRLTLDGDLLIHSDRTRSKQQNLREAHARLAQILEAGLRRNKRRRATRPTRGGIERRLKEKKHRSERKAARRPVDSD